MALEVIYTKTKSNPLFDMLNALVTCVDAFVKNPSSMIKFEPPLEKRFDAGVEAKSFLDMPDGIHSALGKLVKERCIITITVSKTSAHYPQIIEWIRQHPEDGLTWFPPSL